MTSYLSGYRSDTEIFAKSGDQGFLSRVPQPLWSGFLETKSIYDNGTSETRHLLVHECSLIYECNTCRNMFRSLNCFFKHKRLYCCMPFDHAGTSFHKGTNSQKQQPKENFEGLGELILRVLKNKQTDKRHSLRETTVEKVQTDLQCLLGRKPNIRKKASHANEIKICPEETNESLQKLGNSKNTKFICEICKKVFDTGKSLKIHKYKKHGITKYIYQCPSCPLKFPHPTAVVQHLGSEHKKSIQCIKLMRDSIQKRRIHSEEIIKTDLNEQNYPKLRNREVDDTESCINCSYCLKTFNHKTLLAAHQNKCKYKNDYKSFNKCPSDKDKNKKEVFTVNSSQKDTSLYRTDSRAHEINDACLKPKGGSVIADAAQACALLEKCSIDDSVGTTKDDHQKNKSKYLPCLCKICNKHFNALGNLRRHISMFHYRTRKFGCKLCDYRAFRRFDVINHLSHMHSILGDKEAIALEYIDLHEEQICKDDVDDDVILVDNDKTELLFPKELDASLTEENNLPIPENTEQPKSSKRKKYENPFLISKCLQKTIPRDRTKLKRTMSKISVSSSMENRQRRPKRKRTTPVEKDFVYDFSSILKGDIVESETNRNVKRHDPAVQEANSKESTKDMQKQPHYEPLIKCSIDLVKDASQKITLSTVNQGRAAYASVPQLPTQRPQVRVRNTTTYRADFAAVPVIEANDLEEARSKIFDDRFLENLTKATEDFKLKPGLAVLPQSTLNSLLKKVDLTLKNRLKDVKKKDEIKVKNETRVYQNGSEMDSYTKLPCLRQKKKESNVHLKHCLIENKTENNESLLRFALEN